jgi:hypothetical protein
MWSRDTESEQPRGSAGFEERSGLGSVVTVAAFYGAVSTLARVSNPPTATGLSVERVDVEGRRLRTEIEELLVRASDSGGMALGRGGDERDVTRHAG